MGRVRQTAASSVREGDILSIPVDDGFVAAKVLWVSQWYRHAMGIAVYAERFSHAVNAAPITAGYLGFDAAGVPVTVLYLSVEIGTARGAWTAVGHQRLDEREPSLRLHRVAGALYNGDALIRQPATHEDLMRHSTVPAAPQGVVRDLIHAAVGDRPTARR